MCAAASTLTQPGNTTAPVAVIHSSRPLNNEEHSGLEFLLSVAVEGQGAHSTWFPADDSLVVRGHLIDAFLDLWQEHHDSGLILYLSDTTVRRLLKEQAVAFPGLVIRDVIAGGRMRATWELCRASHHQAEVEREPVPVVPELPELMVVATDASRQKRGQVTGLAVVGSDGRVRMNHALTHCILAGEFAAVGMALKTWGGRSRVLWILTDSQKVSHFLNARIGSGARKGMAAQDDCLNKLADLEARGFEVRISWVRGHAGHLLNTYADRAAVAARRCAEFRTDNRSEFNRRLKGELQEALVGIPVAELRDRHIEPTETMAGAGR
ncbi:Ribonuclease H [Corynebacterium occultum]|uniref:Ribonuclease H n=1 Tax=Corynebacterium occultum TaxID=2675219 RepID=A0A6B8W817_9CORY|nr:RNase H family protein [Corynebacterium occultum]QGU06100.1 Ribonuclease H [Corynebacterium occultum]